MKGSELVKSMTARPGAWLGAATALVLGLLSAGASAQTVNRDFPMSKGNAQGTGRMGDPVAYGSGLTNLRWFLPYTKLAITPLVVDNADFLDTRFLTGGPYSPNLAGFAAATPANKSLPGPSPSTGWMLVPEDAEASSPYLVARRTTPVGTLPIDNNPRFPAYSCTATTPSLAGSTDPTQAPNNNADRRFFEWQFYAPASGIQNYALYVWLPYGPTKVNGANMYSQRYFVYEIYYGASQKVVDVVDTAVSGLGWVRLGNGGLANNVVFPWDPNNGIKIRLYNTVPRDANGNLTTGNDVSATNYLVYADAARAVPANGAYTAQPTSVGYLADDKIRLPDSAPVTVTGALNTYERGNRNGSDYTIGKGVVTNYRYSYPTPLWRYSPLEVSEYSTMVDNMQATIAGTGWTISTAGGLYQGDNYYQNSVVTDSAATISTITYAPTLEEGSYEVYAYLPGDQGGSQFGTQVEARISEGTSVTKVYVNQKVGGGWVRLGNRRFLHQPGTSGNGPLKVVFTNYSKNASDAGALVYADAVRFIGAASLTVTSTPVHAEAWVRTSKGGAPALKKVVIVADERGVIHCLDYAGKGDGTTTEYWSYPSTKDPNDASWTDPNQVATLDGVGPIAKMPTRFDTSNALVKTIDGKSYLWIASTNGRVYCLNMEGDGDYNAAGRIGTTTRQWTFPDDYPSAVKSFNLGAFRGSVIYGDATTGAAKPTIYVPAPEGRLYALDALGDATKKTTSILWAYPAEDQPEIGSIQMTPALEFGNVYFGTAKQSSAVGGVFYALKADTGEKVWSFTKGSQAEVTEDMDDFLCGPATVPGTELDNARLGYVAPNDNVAKNPDTVYVVNQNRYVYGLNAHDGTLVSSASEKRLYRTNELSVGSSGNITYTTLDAYSRLGAINQFPVILIPTEDGRMAGLFARAGDYNRYSTASATYRRAYQLSTTSGANLTSITTSNNWLYMGDSSGYLYGFNTDEGLLTGGDGYIPIGSDIIENNPAGDIFRNAKVRLLKKAGYQKLRLPTPNNLTLSEALSSTYSFERDPLAFEWGETMYILVYDFPYAVTDTGGNTVAPPTVNISFSVDGKTARQNAVEARQFKSPQANRDGYAVYAFTFQEGGPNSIPPGKADLTYTISTASLNSRLLVQQIALDPTLSHLSFLVANPLGFATKLADDGTGLKDFQIGALLGGSATHPEDPQNLVNGLKNVSGLEAQLFVDGGYANHGDTRKQPFWVYDRSLLTLQKGPSRGLEGIQMSRTGLRRLGGADSIVNVLPARYGGFEELPRRYPNTSLDYPDISEEYVRFVKDPDGAPQNPILSKVNLNPPLKKGGGALVDETDAADRQLVPTPFELEVQVPKYQPPVSSLWISKNMQSGAADDPSNWLQGKHNSAGQPLYDRGYFGTASLYTSGSASRAMASRGFTFGVGVAPDARILTDTPTLELGVLPEGAGYSIPYASLATDLTPWGGSNQAMYQKFSVLNDGNVNLLNLRVAKGYTYNSGFYSWIFGTDSNDYQATLDGSLDLWSDMNAPFAPTANGFNNVILQKARPGDSTPTSLNVNPVRRPNGNLGVTGGAYLSEANFPVGPPRVAVSVPFGFPVGTYSSFLRVIEDTSTLNEALDSNEAISLAPGVNTSFTVRETRMTNRPTPKATTMVDNLLPQVLTNTNTYWNIEPGAYRDVFGNVVLAWASDRGAYVPSPAQPTSPTSRGGYRLYLGTAVNTTKFTTNGYESTQHTNATQPLRDLNEFLGDSTGNRWITPQTTAGYPTTSLDVLFDVQSGESILSGTERFGNPTFPQGGDRNPFSTSGHESSDSKLTGTYMAFTGEAQKQTPTGRITESKVFVSTVTTASGGKVTLSTPVSISGDVLSRKGKPTIIATNGAWTAIFPSTSAGQSSLNFTTSSMQRAQPLPLSSAFQWATSPSAIARLYKGVQLSAPDGSAVSRIVDLAFVAKVHGLDKPQAYIGRYAANADASPIFGSNGTPWIYFPEASSERLVNDGNGTFRARGVEWNIGASVWSAGGRVLPVRLQQYLANGAAQDLIVPGTVQVSQESGQITADSTLGGQVYINPKVGTIRFSNGGPAKSAVVRVSYVPGFIRVTDKTDNAYNSVSLIYDDHYLSDYNYWFTPTGPASAGSGFTNDRYIFVLGREATGNGTTPRPSIVTMRYGVRIPYKLYVNNNGAVAFTITLQNATNRQLQVDPSGSNGKFFFGVDNEGCSVDRLQAQVVVPETTNTFLYDVQDPDPQTGQINKPVVSLILESEENLVPIDQPVNESNVTAFIDPFSYPSATNMHRERPLLLWLFYASTRSGGPDIYMQTIAPRLYPATTGQ